MKKLSESIWRNISQRSEGIKTRKENIRGNIKKLKPIDIGTDVLWADQDIEVDDNFFFTYEEAEKVLDGTGWRLPTREEAEDIFAYWGKPTKTKSKTFTFEISNDGFLSFQAKGFTSKKDKLYDENEYFCWTSTMYGNSTPSYVRYHYMNINPSEINCFSCIYTSDKDCKICVRPVKDKVNESIWRNISQRSEGIKKRKEDEITDNELSILKDAVKMFRHIMVPGKERGFEIYNNHKSCRYYDNNCEGFIKYINKKKEDKFWVNADDNTYERIIGYVRRTWGDCKNINQYYIKKFESMNESIWRNISQRSEGIKKRKEDNVINNLNPDEFCQYLCDIYETKQFKIKNEQDTRLSVPILTRFEGMADCIHYDYKLNYISMNNEINDYVPDLYKKLYETFECEEVQTRWYVQLRIYPKNGSKFNNSFFIDVIDFIMNNAPQKYINISIR